MKIERTEAIELLRSGPAGVEQWNRQRRAGWEVPSLSEAYLRQTDLGGVDFRDVCLRGALLDESILDGADLSAADLSGADVYHCQLHEANLRGAILTGANCRGADFAGSDLTLVDFRNASLIRSDLARADLTLADFAGANLGDATLENADVTKTSFDELRGLPRPSASLVLEQTTLSSEQIKRFFNWLGQCLAKPGSGDDFEAETTSVVDVRAFETYVALVEGIMPVDDEVKRTLIEARQKVELFGLEKASERRVIEDLGKLAGELRQSPANMARIARLHERIDLISSDIGGVLLALPLFEQMDLLRDFDRTSFSLADLEILSGTRRAESKLASEGLSD